MKNIKKVLIAVFVLVMAISCSAFLFACKDKDEGTAINVCLASEPSTIDPALNSSVDGATLVIHAFAGLVKYNSEQKLVADCATELPTPTVDQATGEATYVFTLRNDLKWSDGSALKASDFEYAWKRAASTELGADYGYMFEVVKGYGEDDVNGLAPLDVTADDTANTLTVVTTIKVNYFFELCAFPAFMPVKKDVVASEDWATKPESYIGNGPYKMTAWEHNTLITFEKNENYYDAANVTMDKINFYLSDDADAMLANYNSGEWQLIDDVPTGEIANLKASKPNEFVVAGQIGTYYISFNNNKDLLPTTYVGNAEARARANQEVRKALALLLDRNYIVTEIGQAGQVEASSFVAMGLTDADGSEFYKNAGASGSYCGYYDASKSAVTTNAASAIEILSNYYTFNKQTGKFTDFPSFVYLYNTNDGHKAIGEYIQGALATYGIPMTLTNQEWNTFLETRKGGDYGVARNGWLADYNDPISFLDMWTSESGNNDSQFGKCSASNKTTAGYYDGSELEIYNLDLDGIDAKFGGESVTNGTWADTYDKVISLIKAETNDTIRYELMHRAEDLLMSTGDICPLYYYTDIYMVKENVKGFFSSPLGYKYFMYTTIEG